MSIYERRGVEEARGKERRRGDEERGEERRGEEASRGELSHIKTNMADVASKLRLQDEAASR